MTSTETLYTYFVWCVRDSDHYPIRASGKGGVAHAYVYPSGASLCGKLSRSPEVTDKRFRAGVWLGTLHSFKRVGHVCHICKKSAIKRIKESLS